MRPAGTDAIGVLRWGLRRYRLLFLAILLLGAVVAPVATVQRPSTVDAEALVIAQRLDIDLAALPRYGQAVFDNGQVAQAVAAQFGDLGAFQDIVPDRVSMVAVQDSIVFTVVGHDTDPGTAADLANVAANAFVESLNAAGVGVGTFAVQSPAEPPVAPSTGLGTVLAIPVGIGAGLLLGLAAVAVLLVARQPVLDGIDAEEVTGVPALGVVTVSRGRRGRHLPEVFAGLIPACRRLLALPAPTVVVASRPEDEQIRLRMTSAVTEVLTRVREAGDVNAAQLTTAHAAHQHGVERSTHASNGHGVSSRPHPTVLDISDPPALLQPPLETATVLVVPEGIGTAALRAAVAEHLGGSAEVRLLLVRPGRRVRARPQAAGDAMEGMTADS
ncbi:hypothetical protein [Geodermatophilus marinus]|uniref:hypothetical protein n=1 Tax=Geodermatophilus sp. LHW52908 TaxID=2303986 RepID=UPI0011C1AA22|nr:hypothetical protein [Geodermatophilus sp. LHW52908]